jgi:ABC-type multidrug transport system fused ATPase/permease subunit
MAKPDAVNSFWDRIDLSGLYKHDRGYFFVVALVMIIVAVLKAIMFYLIVKILHNKKLDMSQPFSREFRRFIINVAYLTLGIGLFSWRGAEYAEWFSKQGVKMPDIQHLSLGGFDVWLFMSVTLFVIAQIFKRGIEIQSENELTV